MPEQIELELCLTLTDCWNVRECERLWERRRVEGERSVSRQESRVRAHQEEQEDTERECEEPSPEVIAAHRRDRPKVIINVGGERHEVMWRLLELRPLTRLGMLG